MLNVASTTHSRKFAWHDPGFKYIQYIKFCSFSWNCITCYSATTLSPSNYWQHCAQCKPPVFSLLRGRFWGFSPHRGDTLHRWEWNLAWRMGTEGPLLHAKFHLHRCNDKGVGPQELKFLLRFDQNVEYKHCHLLITGSIARSANLPVFSLLRGRFWGFSPRRGDTLHRWGWNLAWRRGPKVPSSLPNFTPIGATTRV